MFISIFVLVAHKGFPTSQNVINLMIEFTRARNENELTSAEVDNPRNRERIEKFLKGLKVTYQIPKQQDSKQQSTTKQQSTAGTKRTYRVNGLGPKANAHKFNCGKKEEKDIRTIESYFAAKKNYKLRHPDLPCLWVGAMSREERIYLPAEVCSNFIFVIIDIK